MTSRINRNERAPQRQIPLFYLLVSKARPYLLLKAADTAKGLLFAGELPRNGLYRPQIGVFRFFRDR